MRTNCHILSCPRIKDGSRWRLRHRFEWIEIHARDMKPCRHLELEVSDRSDDSSVLTEER